VNTPVSIRRLAQGIRFIPRRGQPDCRPGTMEIEHDLRCAWLADIQRDVPNLIETHTGRHRSGLRRRLLYLGAACHSGKSESCGKRNEQKVFHIK
jgi:hypothetical protein